MRIRYCEGLLDQVGEAVDGLQISETAYPNRRLPESPFDWVCCPERLVNLESHLYFFRHGAVFHDPAGILADVQGVLHTYPEDIWLLRMAQLCFDIALGYFQHAVMAPALVMERDYTPYWKLLHYVFRSREISAALRSHRFGQ